eukprot:1148331-Pelagomonas_calceolata.AAC.2
MQVHTHTLLLAWKLGGEELQPNELGARCRKRHNLPGPAHRPRGRGSRPGSNGSSHLPVMLMHPLCKPWVQADAELPGRAIALLPLPLGAAHVKK